MMKPDIVAIGASAGGVEAVSALLGRLPPDLPAAFLVVLHRPIDVVSHLPAILRRAAHMRVAVAHEGERLEPGTCLVSPPDRHLTVTRGQRIHLLPNGFYRSHTIDALFNSLAHAAGSRTIGVILSGMLKDGTLGLTSIKEAGGVAVVQDPAEAAFSSMPSSAIMHDGKIDAIGSIDAVAAFICHTLGRSPLGMSAMNGSRGSP